MVWDRARMVCTRATPGPSRLFTYSTSVRCPSFMVLYLQYVTDLPLFFVNDETRRDASARDAGGTMSRAIVYSRAAAPGGGDEGGDEEDGAQQRPAFLVTDGEPGDESVPPGDGLEYLRRVRRQEQGLPTVLRAQIDPERIRRAEIRAAARPAGKRGMGVASQTGSFDFSHIKG